MPPRRKLGWRKESLILMGSGVAVTLLLTLGVAILAPLLDRLSVFSVPVGILLAAEAGPIILVIAAFWFVFRQEAIDRKYHLPDE